MLPRVAPRGKGIAFRAARCADSSSNLRRSRSNRTPAKKKAAASISQSSIFKLN
jgi:hypothetical protein